MKIKIFFHDNEILGELQNTKTAKTIYDSLPLDGAAIRWEEEVYFAIPVRISPEKDATEEVREGDIAYWPQGQSFCVFFGKEPNSTGNKTRAASKVNVFGKIEDISLFHNIKDGDLIIVERA